VLRLRGGGGGLTVCYGDRKESIPYMKGNIGNALLFSRLGILPSTQVLKCDGEILDDSEFFFSDGVLEYHQLADIYSTDEDLVLYWGKKLYLTVNGNSGPTALSIGAGGSIIQHIERDENNPRIWDVANIQIIDSTTFRSLTGLEPPKSP
jgi:hypothetical protein